MVLKEKEKRPVWDEEGVCFLFYRDGNVLLEERSLKDPKFPGLLIVPGGKSEEGETQIDTLIREAREELGNKFQIKEYRFLVSFLHFDLRGKLLQTHAFLVNNFEGELTNQELGKAKHLWIPIGEAFNRVPLASSKLILSTAIEQLNAAKQYKG